MPSRLSSYAYINAKIRTRISTLLGNDRIDTLARSTDLASLFDSLAGTEYERAATVYAETHDADLAEIATYEAERSLFAEILGHLEGPPRAVVEAAYRRFEIENLKAAIRLWFESAVMKRPVERKITLLPDAPWPTESMGGEIVEATDVDALRQILSETNYGIEDLVAGIPEAGNVFRVEVALDRWFARQLSDAISQLPKQDRDPAERLFGVQIDIENIRRIARLSAFYELDHEAVAEAMIIAPGSRVRIEDALTSEGRNQDSDEGVFDINALAARRFPELAALLGDSGSLLERLDMLESVLEETLEIEVRKVLGGYPFTVGIILSYFVLKERESRRIRSVLNELRYGFHTGA